jgi:hypothetical protein
MTIDEPKDLEARRAYRQLIRNVGRLLRWTGIVLVLIGTIGIASGGGDAWFVTSSWVSFTIGWALMLSGVVQRVRTAHR